MYHLDINGQRVTNLRLSPTTRRQDLHRRDHELGRPGDHRRQRRSPLPHLAITPVIRSDGSGTIAQFTAFMASQTPSVWQAFCAKEGINLNPCPPTSLYPPFDGSVAQQLSDGVAAFVAAPYNNGAITYVEYGYAKQRGFPVASLLNKAGYYTQPTALQRRDRPARRARSTPTHAEPHRRVRQPRPAHVPVSSYSYMIVPTTTATPFTTDKGATLGAVHPLLRVRRASRRPPQLGYSPLPKNLVQDAFTVEQQIPGAPSRRRSPSCPTRRSTVPTLAAGPGGRRGRQQRGDRHGHRNRRRPGHRNGPPGPVPASGRGS